MATKYNWSELNARGDIRCEYGELEIHIYKYTTYSYVSNMHVLYTYICYIYSIINISTYIYLHILK